MHRHLFKIGENGCMKNDEVQPIKALAKLLFQIIKGWPFRGPSEITTSYKLTTCQLFIP